MDVPAFAGKPCPAWAYGALVAPGPHFIYSGFHSQNTQEVDGHEHLVFGQVLVPSHATLRSWAEYVVKCIQDGTDPSGGWAPHRSCVARWGRNGADRSTPQVFYYKADDDSMFDLQYFPLPQPIVERAAIITMTQRCDEFFHILTEIKDELMTSLPTKDKKMHMQERFDSYIEIERLDLNRVLAQQRSGVYSLYPITRNELPLVILDSDPSDDMLMMETNGGECGECLLAQILALDRPTTEGSRNRRRVTPDTKPEDHLGEPLAKNARTES